MLKILIDIIAGTVLSFAYQVIIFGISFLCIGISTKNTSSYNPTLDRFVCKGTIPIIFIGTIMAWVIIFKLI